MLTHDGRFQPSGLTLRLYIVVAVAQAAVKRAETRAMAAADVALPASVASECTTVAFQAHNTAWNPARAWYDVLARTSHMCLSCYDLVQVGKNMVE